MLACHKSGKSGSLHQKPHFTISTVYIVALHLCTFIYIINLCIFIYIYIYLFIYIYICIYLYIHLYIFVGLHLHQPMVCMDLSLFAIPVVAQIIVTFYYATGP